MEIYQIVLPIISFIVSDKIIRKKVEYEDYAKKYVELFTYLLFPMLFLVKFPIVFLSFLSFIFLILKRKYLSFLFLILVFPFSNFKEIILILSVILGLWKG